MIKTNPAYINGEFLDIKDYFTHLFFTKDRFLYTSIQNWWIQTTLYCSLLQSFVSLLLSVGISCIELSDIYEPIMDTDIILSIIWMPYLYSLPTFWMVTYYYSFIAPKRATRKLEQFIARYIQGASDIIQHSPTNYTLEWKGINFEVGYTIIPEIAPKGKVKRNHECFFFCVYYGPLPASESLLFDENGYMLDTFVEEWNAYCKDKKSCRQLMLGNFTILGLFKRTELSDDREVTEAMEQLQYLLQRFGLFTLHI